MTIFPLILIVECQQWGPARDQVFTVIKLDRMDTMTIIEHDREAEIAHDAGLGKIWPMRSGFWPA